MKDNKRRISQYYKKCVICGVRRIPNSNVHLFQFPLNPVWCKLWVQAAGVEDFVHLPIEKLHQLKFLCDSHFTPNSFKASGTGIRLVKHAVPLINLPTPLADELFAEFPLHVSRTSLHRFPNARKFPDRLRAWVSLLGGKLENASDFEFIKKKMVCDRHFTEADRDRNQRLNALAVPSLYLQGIEKILHTFPHPRKDQDRFKAWIFAIGGEIVGLDDYFIFKQRRVCRLHFEDMFLCRNNRISNNAIPSLHLRGYRPADAPRCKKLKPNNPPEPAQQQPVEHNVAEDQSCEVDENIPDSDSGYKPPEPAQQQLVEHNAAEDQSSDVDENIPDVLPRSPSPNNSDVPDAKADPGPFSWQKSLPLCVETDVILPDILEPDFHEPVINLDAERKQNVSKVPETPIKDEGEKVEEYISEIHSEFSCDHCLGEIIGFRYTCIQCENFDLCRACESRLVHPHHYMLRVPKPRPFGEIRSVVAAIRVKIKLLEEAFKQNSEGWADVVIKKEEDPLEYEETVAPPPATEETLEEFLVPNVDSNDSQANTPDVSSTLGPIPDVTGHLPRSTSAAESSVQKSTTTSKTLQVQSGISDKDVRRNKVSSNSNILLKLRKVGVPNTNVKLNQETATSKGNIKFYYSRRVADKNKRLQHQNASTSLVLLQQKQVTPKTDEVQYLQIDRPLNIKRTVQDTVVETDRQKTDSSKSVLPANTDATAREMVEEYLDEVWLDESVL